MLPFWFVVLKSGSLRILVDCTSTMTIYHLLESNTHFSKFFSFLELSGFNSLINNAGPFTIFAPINTAFNELPKGRIAALADVANNTSLINTIRYHIINMKFESQDFENGQLIKSLYGERVEVVVKQEEIYINEGRILFTLKSDNGNIHAINEVLTPDSRYYQFF